MAVNNPDLTYYPVLFKPIYKEMIWGGRRLLELRNSNTPPGKIGESWDISCRPQEMGIIENGSMAGYSFEDYIKINPAAVLGTRLADSKVFPLLVKLIDASDALSIQVHPCDGYMQKKGGTDGGKAEMWYILNPPDDGHLIIGLKPGVTARDFKQALENGTVEDCLNRLRVSRGDIVNIPAGLVHALTPGVMVAEVQQNSDITYRLYDYNRLGPDGLPRALHIDDALAVSDFDGKIPKRTVPGLKVVTGGNELVYAICNTHFAIIKYVLTETLTEESNPEAFSIFTCVKGCVRIDTDKSTVELPTGRSVFIPAKMGRYRVHPIGNAVLLKSFVPDPKKDFFDPLQAYGYKGEDILLEMDCLPKFCE